MKCCGSPTISIAAEPRSQDAIVADRMKAMLFAQALKPLAASLGQFGDVAIEAVAERTFVRDAR